MSKVIHNNSCEFISNMNNLIEDYVWDNMTRVKTEQLGLDRRAGYELFVDHDHIAVSKNADRSLQYYGGFEYVSQEHRCQMGDYVFYSAESSRVQEALEHFFDSEHNEEEVGEEEYV